MNLNQKNTSFLRYLALNTLWEGVSSETLQYCLLIGSNVQALAFTIYRLFTFVPTSSTGTLSYVTNRLIKLFLIKATLVDGASQEGLLITHIFAWLYNGLIAGFLVLCALNKFRNRNLSTRLRFFMMILFQFHLCFGFAYIILILLNTIINSAPRETLAQGSHSYGGIILTIDIASVTLSTLVGLFAAVFSYDPFLSKNFLSCRSPSCQFIIFVYKVLLCPATFLFVGTLASTWIMNIGTMILFTVRHFYLFKRFPYYNFATMRISITLSTICLVISWVNLVTLIITSISTTNLTTESILYVEILLIFLSLKFCNNCFLNIARKHLVLQNKELKSEDQVFIKFFALRVLMGASTISSIPAHASIFYWGAYQDFIHQQTEKGLDWNKPHNFSIDEMRKLTLEEFQLLSAKFKRDLEVDFMKEAVERMKNSRMVTVLLVDYLMDSIDSLSTSVFYLTRISKSQVFEGVIISKFYEKVQQNVTKVLLENKGSELLDIQKYIDSEFVSRNFLNLLTVNAKSYADYWTYYEEQNMAMIALFEKHTQIEQQSKEIHYYWTKYVEMNRHIFKSLVPVYSYYQSLVNNRPVTAAKLLKKHQAIYDQNLHHIKVTSLLQSDLNDPNILILQASMSREKLGVIRNVSSQISEILGWTSKDVVGRNVNIIMPAFMREPHHQMLQKHLQDIQDISSSTRMNRVTESFVLNREGYVVPCEVYISIHPYILEELVYIAIIKVREMKEGLILLSEGGYIEGLSNQMEKSVGRTQGQKLHMQEICKNYKEIENIVKVSNSSPVSLVNNDRKFTGNSFNNSPIIKPTTFNDLEHISISLTLVNFETSRKKRRVEDSHHYSTIIKPNIFFETRFYVLELTLDVKSQVLDDSSSDEAIGEIGEENSIPSEKNSEEEVVPYSFRRSRSTQFLTYKSDSHRGLLEPTNFLSFQSNVSPKVENKTLIQNIQINEIDNNSISSHIDTKKNINKKQDKQRGLQIILRGSQEGSVALGENYDAQMEEAVNSNPKTEHLAVIKWIGMIWIFVIPFTLLWIQLEKNTVTSLVNGNIDFTSQATQLLANVVELNRATRYIILDDMGLISVNKYGVEAKYVLQGPIIDLSIATNTLSNNIRNSLDKIDTNLRNTAYGLKVPIIDVNAEGISKIVSEINVFDFIVEIASRGIKLGNIPMSHLNGTLPEVSFIVNNTFNDFLVIWEQMRPLLVEDSRLKLRTQETLIGVLWGVISVIGLVILAVISDALKNFRKKRDHLLNILLRLDDKQISKHTQRVQKFVRILEKGFVSPSINEKIEEELFENYEAKSQSSHNIKKSFKIEGINSTLYRRYALVIVFFLAMMSIYVILFALARCQTSLISNKINLMVQSYDYYYHTTLASAILYDYVQNNITTTVRNRPIQEELDSLFSELSQVQDFYVGTMISKKTRLTSNQTLYGLVQGNICSLYDFGPEAEEICTTTDGGILKNGVVGLNSYLLATFESLIASFENSPRAFSDMYALINSPQLILEEVVQYMYLEPVYDSLGNLIRSSLQDDQDRYMKVFECIITVFSILCFSIAWICWVYITKTFELEMILWMKMIRQVPWDVLVNNKLLKAYLVKNRGKASSVNN